MRVLFVRVRGDLLSRSGSQRCAHSPLSHKHYPKGAPREGRAREPRRRLLQRHSPVLTSQKFLVLTSGICVVLLGVGREVSPQWNLFMCRRFPNCEFNELTPLLCADSPCAASPRWRWLWLRAWVRALAGRRPGRSIGIAPSSLEGITRREHFSRLGSSWAIGITPSSLERITRREHSSSPRQKAL